MTLLMYGAGNIGRGFIGNIFANAGYEVAFVDIDERLINAFNSKGEYSVEIAAAKPYSIGVSGVRGVDGKDQDAVVAEIASCDIMATSLGGAVLERVAPLIARGLIEREKAGKNSLDILICENLKDSVHKLKSWLEPHIPDQLKEKIFANLGLVETVIGRMVPVIPFDEANPLAVRVEEYDFLPVDRTAFRGIVPTVPQIIPSDNFGFYEERKLYLHNMGHAVCAYLGLAFGYKSICEAMEDSAISFIVKSSMVESAAMLSVNHGVPFYQIYKHVEDLLKRFRNPVLDDSCERVARDPMRKLAADDRFAAPLRNCLALGIEPANIAMGVAAVLVAQEKEEKLAKEILVNTCRLNDKAIEIVIELYRFLLAGKSLQDCMEEIGKIASNLRGKII